jgi:hypothetical protein
LEGLDQPGDRRGERWATQPVQLRAPRTVRHDQQVLQPRDQVGRRRSGQADVQPTRGPIAHRCHQPGQHTVAGQQDLLGEQSAVRGAEQHRGSDVVGPRLPIQIKGEQEARGLSGEVAISVPVANLRGVPPPHRKVPISVQHNRIGDVELAGHRRQHRIGDGGGIGQKGADRADRHQLYRKPQPGGLIDAAARRTQVVDAQVAHRAHPVPIQVGRKGGVPGEGGRIDDHGHDVPQSRAD